MKKPKDDWDVKVLGADPDAPKPVMPQNANLRDMVNYLRDRTVVGNMSINAPVNGPAMTKIFKDMLSENVTSDQIYRMIDLFSDDIRRTPLNSDQVPWRVFASRRSELLKRIAGDVAKQDSSEYTFDPRLEKYLND
jgi:hypothetical protein